jgi:hypothetical protein
MWESKHTKKLKELTSFHENGGGSATQLGFVAQLITIVIHYS